MNADKLDAWITGSYGDDHPDNNYISIDDVLDEIYMRLEEMGMEPTYKGMTSIRAGQFLITVEG